MVSAPNSKKIAFITGANKGIGFEVARQLGRHGMAVIIGARDPQRGADAAATLRGEGIDARPVQLDVTDTHNIRAAVHEVERVFGRLDVLVNNAGVALDRGMLPSAVPADVLRRTYETNVFGPVAVIQDLIEPCSTLRMGRHLAACPASPSWKSHARTSATPHSMRAMRVVDPYLQHNTRRSSWAHQHLNCATCGKEASYE